MKYNHLPLSNHLNTKGDYKNEKKKRTDIWGTGERGAVFFPKFSIKQMLKRKDLIYQGNKKYKILEYKLTLKLSLRKTIKLS